jgi:branched-chain amino acid transport system permease protein
VSDATQLLEVNMTAELFFGLLPPTIVDGLSIGLMYAVIALGYTMVYGVLEFINFAHSEIFMVGAVVGVEVITALLLPTGLHPLLQLLIAIVVAAAVAGGLAVAVERVAYRPLRLRNAPKLVPLISAIGMSLFLIDIMRLILNPANPNRPFPSSGAFDFFSNQLNLGIVNINFKTLTVFVVVMVMLAGLIYLVNYTNLGRAIRAVAQDQGTSSLMGINVNSIIVLTFFIGGALGGVAGVLYALKYGVASPVMGFLPGLKAFTAAVLGGIGSIPGAMLGGLILGLLETFAGTYLPLFTNDQFGTEYKDIVAFGLLIVILIFKPAGLLGKAVAEKV